MSFGTNLLALLDECPDSLRFPLIVENPDWEEKLSPALVELGKKWEEGIDIVELVTSIRILVETSYALGYKTGERSSL